MNVSTAIKFAAREKNREKRNRKSAPARRSAKACSVRDAIRAAQRNPRPREAETFSHVTIEVRGANGKLKYRSARRHNLTTDTATGYTNRRDWQAKAMGGGFAPFATATGFLTAATGTLLTNAGASFPTAGQGLSGCLVVVGPNNAGAGSTVWGVIISNTSTALTVDKVYNGGTWATGTTPNATGAYMILPGQAPAMWMALTANSGPPAASDTTLAAEITTNGFARVLGTYAHTAAATTYTLSTTFTCTGGSTTLNMEAIFGSAVQTAGGVMPFESAIPSPPTLISGDTVTETVTITIN